MNSTTPFLFDPVAGETLSYGDLERLVPGPALRLPTCLRAPRLSEFFVTLIQALATDTDVTLVDADLSESELAGYGLDTARLAVRADRSLVLGPGGIGDLLIQVRRCSRSRITLHTSGSTGLPRRVVHTLDSLGRGLRIGPRHADDVWGFAYPPTHIAGVQVFLQALFNLNPLVNLFQLPREAVLDLARSRGLTHLSATPSFYRLLLPADPPLGRVRSVTLGGERTDAALLRRLRPLFPNARFHNIYASTEAGTVLVAEEDVFTLPPEARDRIRIRDGHLEIHREWLGEFPEASAPAPGSAPADPWYTTGDVVDMVSESPPRFRIVSRDRDWINVGGHKVNPAEIEAALQDHPAVRDVRVFARPNSVVGSLLCAEIVAVGAAPDEADLRAFLAPRLQPHKLPRYFRFVSEMNRTRTGKLKRDA